MRKGFDRTVLPLELSPVIRQFGQKRLRVGYVEYSPFSVSKEASQNGLVTFDGVDFSLIYSLADAFNVSLVPVRDPEATWGAKRRGRWTGIAGMVSRKEVDFAVSASFQTPYREEVLDYTHYYYIQVVKFIVRSPAEKPRALLIVRPFAVEVWLGVLVAYLVSLAMLVAVMHSERRNSALRFLSAGDVALALYLGIIWQGCDRRFSSTFKRRLVAASWWLLCTVISCAYCGLLISFMSHPGMEPALDTLAKLRRAVLAQRIFVGTTRHTEMELAFTSAKSGVIHDIGRQMLEHPGRTLVTDAREGYRRCLRSRYAYVFPETVLKVEEARTAGLLLVSRDAFYHAMAVYTFPKGSPFVATFSYGMKNFMFTGLVEKWLNDFLWQLRMNTKHSGTDQGAERPINVVDLQGAFFVLVMGCTAGLLALVAESCWAFFSRRITSTVSERHRRAKTHRASVP
ncbi:glutamate receptor U1-like [Haemaphysalis longicornis]